MRDLTRGSLASHIVAMAIPMAIGMGVQTLYYFVDLYFVARLGQAELAGVSAAGNALFMILALTQTLNVGTIAVVSHASGQKDQARANRAFNQAVGLGATLTIAAVIGGYALSGTYMAAIGSDVEARQAAMQYFRWFVPALSLQFGLVAQGGALQGTGVVKPTMTVQLISVATNILLTPILVAGWFTGVPLGVEGAGIATLLSVLVGIALMTSYILIQERYLRFDPTEWWPRLEVWRQILGIGWPAGSQFALMFLFISVIYSVIAVFGAAAHAGYGVGFRVMQGIFLPAMAVAFSVPAIAGQNFGAQNAARVTETFRVAMAMNVAIMLPLTILCQIQPDLLIKILAVDPAATGDRHRLHPSRVVELCLCWHQLRLLRHVPRHGQHHSEPGQHVGPAS